MKSLIANLDEVLEFVDQFSQYDEISMKAIICTLIDVMSEKCKEPAGDIAELVCHMVHAINEELGPFTTREV